MKNNLDKNDPFNYMKSAKYKGIVTEKSIKDKRDNSETTLQTKICKWLCATYPGILFLSDFAAGIQLTPYLAKLRSSQSCDDKMVDLFIFGNDKPLFLELKTDSAEVFLKDGVTLCSEHLQRQYETIKKFRLLGYYADFAIGENDIKAIIRGYMIGNIEYTPVRDNPTHLAKLTPPLNKM